MSDQLFTQKIVCKGGLVTNSSDLGLSENMPGAATQLINFESSLYGGYRRINGYIPWSDTYPEVDPANAEGAILGIAWIGNEIIAARKQRGSATYKWYHLQIGGWTAYATTFTLTSTGVTRIRWDRYNFGDIDKIILVDGVNKATVFDGTNWYQINPAATGADTANAGGAQAIGTPKFVKVFYKSIFLWGDNSTPGVVAHSAPAKDYDWTAASGAGQIIPAFSPMGMWPFRDSLYLFGEERIKKIILDNNLNFVLQDVTTNIGCIAPDSIQEFGGDLIFLSQDGFRPISGTNRIGDVQIESISKQIQQITQELSETYPLENVVSVVIRSKSQIRFFFSSDVINQTDSKGIIGSIRSDQTSNNTLYGNNSSYSYEWGELLGIRASCCMSYYQDGVEYVFHGDYDGVVYRQEQGNNFNGQNITWSYASPYLDLGDTGRRKTIRRVILFLRPEGDSLVNTQLSFDWNQPDKLNPSSYASSVEGSFSTYGTGVYGTAIYGGISTPYFLTNVEGSGFSTKYTFSGSDMNAPFTIHAFIFNFSVEGRK